MNRSEILQEAERIVTKDRQQTHGAPENSFKAIADLWAAYLGIPITPMECCHMMVMLKIVRAKGNPTYPDNHVDGAGYFACGGEIATCHSLPPQSAVGASEPSPGVRTAEGAYDASKLFLCGLCSSPWGDNKCSNSNCPNHSF